MTTITASVQANTVSKSWNANVAQTITKATPLCRDVANLVAQYLPPIDGWITEWTGERGREVVAHAVRQAETSLPPGPVNLITQYCQKSDVFGLGKIEEAAGGQQELTKLIGKYNPERPLPLDIDDEMQAPLSQHFDADTLQAFHEYRTSRRMPLISKMTELYSLYWAPAGVTPNSAEQLGKKHGAGFEYFRPQARQEHGNTPTAADCWIAFPNDVFGRNKPVSEQEALIPAGFEFPHVQDAVFCVFVRYACTDVRIMSQEPWTYTRCQEETEGDKLVVGGFGARGLRVNGSSYDSANFGVAVVRKFCIGH